MLAQPLYAWIVLVGLCLPLSQSGSQSHSDALALLKQSSQRYADAKSYHIEVIEERASKAELKHEWEKSFFSAIEAPGHRYLYAARSANGSSMVISDGKTEWIYHVDDVAYIRRTASGDGPAPPADLSFVDFELFEVTLKVRETLAGLADNYQSAESLPDEILDLDGQKISCTVVRVRDQDLKKPGPPGSSSEKTIWIEKDNRSIRKIVTQAHAPVPMAPKSFEDTDTTELYPVADLDGAIAENIFSFTPPITAKLVEKFPSPFSPGADLTGSAAPPFVLKSPEGKEVSLSSLRGKPVLLDFWATWCLPCVASMPQMADLYGQTKDKGLVFISIDEDADSKTAADFLSKRHEPWSNFHDPGDVGKAFKKSGIPLTVLIDAKGTIVYYKAGYGDSSLSDLRAAIAKLGPEYASVTQQTVSH